MSLETMLYLVDNLLFSPNQLAVMFLELFEFLFHEDSHDTDLWKHCGVWKYCTVCLYKI